MANLLPALEGLNQLLIKQVEEKKVKDKQTRGASLISEYKTKLDQAKSSQEVADINSWLLKESQVRDVEDVQQTAYYMLNNYGKKFEEQEKQTKLNEKIAKQREGYKNLYDELTVYYKGKETKASEFVNDAIKANPDITAEEINAQLKEIKVETSEDISLDPNTKKIVVIRNRKNNLGYAESAPATILSFNNGNIFRDVEKGKVTTKDAKGVETTKEVIGQAGIYDEGIDEKITPEEILKYKSGEDVLKTVYNLNPVNAPAPRGGSGGYRGGSSGKTKKDNYFAGYTPTKAMKGIENSIINVYEKSKNKYKAEIIKELDSDNPPFNYDDDADKAKKIEAEASKRASFHMDNINKEFGDLENETETAKGINLFNIAIETLKEGSALDFNRPLKEFEQYEFKKDRDKNGLLVLYVRYPLLRGKSDKWFEVKDNALKNTLVAFDNGD